MSIDYAELVEYLDTKFVAIDNRFGAMESSFDGLEKRFDGLEQKFAALEGQVSQLPTKSYMDNKFAEMEGRMTTLVLKNEYKTNRLIEILKNNKTLKDYEYKELREFGSL